MKSNRKQLLDSLTDSDTLTTASTYSDSKIQSTMKVNISKTNKFAERKKGIDLNISKSTISTPQSSAKYKSCNVNNVIKAIKKYDQKYSMKSTKELSAPRAHQSTYRSRPPSDLSSSGEPVVSNNLTELDKNYTIGSFQTIDRSMAVRELSSLHSENHESDVKSSILQNKATDFTPYVNTNIQDSLLENNDSAASNDLPGGESGDNSLFEKLYGHLRKWSQPQNLSVNSQISGSPTEVNQSLTEIHEDDGTVSSNVSIQEELSQQLSEDEGRLPSSVSNSMENLSVKSEDFHSYNHTFKDRDSDSDEPTQISDDFFKSRRFKIKTIKDLVSIDDNKNVDALNSNDINPSGLAKKYMENFFMAESSEEEMGEEIIEEIEEKIKSQRWHHHSI